jgi:hypothetical protein
VCVLWVTPLDYSVFFPAWRIKKIASFPPRPNCY